MVLGISLSSFPIITNTTTALLQPFPSPLKRGSNACPSRRKASSRSITAQLELKPPPYELDALEPYISRETLEHHWGRHHKAHVEALNAIIDGTELDGMELEDMILASYNKGNWLPTFDHAAQIWNNEFFWQSMRPGGGGRPTGVLLDLIERDFGSFDTMMMKLHGTALNQFGSGWVWLAYKANKLDIGNAVNPYPSEKDNKLVITKTPNAVNPLVWDYSPILAIDVWEHAYYLDYANRRADYVSKFLENLVSWEVVSTRLEEAIAGMAARRRDDERRQQDEEQMASSKAVEMYLDSDIDEPEAD